MRLTYAQRCTCPHCGNTDPATIQDNGLGWRDHDLTLLCVKPCDPSQSSLDDPAADVCGCQWDPNGLALSGVTP